MMVKCPFCSYPNIRTFATKRARKEHIKQVHMCESCQQNYADPPSKLCPGCQAYKEHQQ